MFWQRKNKGKVFVGLSGGVDSAVSAALLKAQGYDVTGVFIRISLSGYPCSAGVDKIEAMRVAAHLSIPFLEVDLSKEYAETVLATTVGEYAKGNTPNPDTLCNREIKFGKFYDFARAHGADYIATGHYAQIKNGELHTSVDDQKDQSYFLWMVPKEVLPHVLFPVGGLRKPHVRALAKKFKLPNAVRKDSQGLCFLGDTSVGDLLAREITLTPGNVLDEQGRVVGSHSGVQQYTLGQRHGFVLHAQTPDTAAHFVVGKDIEKNTLIVSTSPYPQGSTATHITLRESNWIGDIPPGPYEARFRYRQTVLSATLVTAEPAQVVLQAPRHVPHGQSLVLYKGTRCLGGGIVEGAKLQ